MSPELGLLLSFGLFLGLLTVGMAVPFAILIPGMAYLYFEGGFPAFKALGLISWANLNSFTLTAIPLFFLMAEILVSGGLIARVYRGLSRLLSPIPGGLLQSNIGACAIFAAVSGSSVTTAAAVGNSALPQLIARRYDRALSAGSLAAGGTLGILIPPSLAMIIYSTFTDTSAAKLFMAGVLPGLVLTLMFMAYIAFRAITRPSIAPREVGVQSVREALRALADIGPIGLLVLLTLGSMYLGWATPTEAAAVGCVGAIVLSMLFGQLTWREFEAATRRTTLVVGNIMFLVFAAFVFSHAISYGGVGEAVTTYVISLDLSRWEFLFTLFVLFTVLGCLVESLGMIVITVPLLYPILPHYGIDPIWFGILLVVYIEMGQISPPIGINLFVIQSLWNGRLSEVVIGTIPFHLIMFVLLLLLMLWPDLALWLPRNM